MEEEKRRWFIVTIIMFSILFLCLIGRPITGAALAVGFSMSSGYNVFKKK